MKLSIFTTITRPNTRGDNYKESLACYADLADEVVVVDGKHFPGTYLKDYDNVRQIYHYWPQEFQWQFIGKQFQRGYEVCTGDIVIHADIDFIFHEKDFEAIRQAAGVLLDSQTPAMSMWKYQFVQPDRYNLKSRLVTMVNKRDFGDRIKFNSGGDLCQPSLDDKELMSSEVPEAGVAFYNYEKLSKTEAQIVDDVGRMDRAYKKYFHEHVYSATGKDKDAYKGWLKMALGRYSKPQKQIALEDHPKYIQDTIKNLKEDQFGCNAFGNLERNNYVQGR